jgi:hypothetical protein
MSAAGFRSEMPSPTRTQARHDAAEAYAGSQPVCLILPSRVKVNAMRTDRPS